MWFAAPLVSARRIVCAAPVARRLLEERQWGAMIRFAVLDRHRRQTQVVPPPTIAIALPDGVGSLAGSRYCAI